MQRDLVTNSLQMRKCGFLGKRLQLEQREVRADTTFPWS